jgi:sugar lactone lactonase YvrE
VDARVDCLLERRDLLGESPVWSVREQALWWVDIHRPSIQRWDLGAAPPQAWPMPENVGSIGLAADGLVAALRHGFARFDPASGRIERLAEPLEGRTRLRFNDGRVDPRGRFWVATVSEDRTPGVAELYRLDARTGCSVMAGGFTVGNGIAWSPDAKTMYFADSWARCVYAYEFDADEGRLGARRVFAQFAPDEGIPDGATVDAHGCYWVAHFDGAMISRYAPDGRRDLAIPMPVPRPTSCAFVGPDLDTLLVTSASFNLSQAQRESAPLSGSIFRVRTAVGGLPDPVFDPPQARQP